MVYSRSASFGADVNTGLDATRLVYSLSPLSRSHGFELIPGHKRGERISEFEIRDIIKTLHPVDLEIVRELRSGQVYGNVNEAQVARLLPLLTRRKTYIEGTRLRMTEIELIPRARGSQTEKGSPLLELGFIDEDGDWHGVEDGRVLAGPVAYLLKNARASLIKTDEPWQLARWGAGGIIPLTGPGMTPARRDQLSRELRAVGVPEEDFSLLAVHRGPPDKFIVYVWQPDIPDAIVVQVKLEAEYQGVRVPASHAVESNAVHIEVPDTERLIERDLASEDEARTRLRRLGFKYSREADAFVGRGELALNALDRDRSIFPSTWEVVLSSSPPIFHDDVKLTTELKLLEDRGLLDLSFAFHVTDKIETTNDQGETITTEQTIESLLNMKDLLLWLQSGQKYLRLEDGSYVAPSEDFKKNLRILEDMGADSERILVSPLCIGLLRMMNNTTALKAADAATKAWLDELASDNKPAQVEQPESLQGELRDYQRRGLDWLSMLHRHRLTGILADDMGLGKTMQAISLLLKIKEDEGFGQSLVVAPTSVVTVWRDEIQRFAPAIRIAMWHGSPKLRYEIDLDDNIDVIITSYGVLRRDAEMLSERQFRYIILDEAQSAKNAASQNATAIRQLKSERRLALTGTPIENRPEELWTTFDFLAPGFLGSLRQFRKRYARPISRGDGQALEMLATRVQPLILRRLKSEVAKELPEKVETVIRCELNEDQRALYDHLAGRLRKEVEEKVQEVGIQKAHLDILAALTRLRQVCCDPELLKGNETLPSVPDSAKLQAFEELMREALESGRRIIVFSQFVEMQKRIIQVIKKLGVNPLWLHGGTRDRDKVVAKFQDPEGPPVIVVSLRAGGTGLTLTRADTVIHYDPWWNPAVERQATDRAHRLGQTQTVLVYKLVCSETIEERVLELADRKEALASDILGSDFGGGAKRISPSEVMSLIQ
ncbi:MAG: DEAD/DEAH box helicase [Myxococcota bacterium]|nr:DEAD/DEAH box helicase [Myxococcota bacterium]